MSADYQHSILWRGEDPNKIKFKPKYDGNKKITRYFPGQAPKFAGEDDQSSDDEAFKGASSASRQDVRLPKPGALADARPGAREAPKGEGFSRKSEAERTGRAERLKKQEAEKKPCAVIEDAAISRLKRLQAQSQDDDGGREARLARHRAAHDARVLEAADEEEEEQVKAKVLEEAKKDPEEEIARIRAKLNRTTRKDDLKKDVKDEDEDTEVKVKPEVKAEDEEDDAEMRRERARELALLRRKQEEIALLKEEADNDDPEDEDEDEEESEEEESEEDDPRRGVMMKPVFVSKAQRETVKEREALEKEEELALERKKEKEKERKVESKGLLIEEIRREEEAQSNVDENDASDMELIDDDDEKNEAEEYEKWKIRELKRIKRDKEERLTRERELEYIERRRRMTDEEREEDDKRLDAGSKQKEEAKAFGFLQKYYHRGGFFQDKAVSGEEPLYLRDVHEPLDSEKYNKELLPKAMQLRRGEFGKKGQVKHTHLTESDTTDKTAAWAQHTKQVAQYQQKMAGAKGIMNFDRPALRSSGSGG